MSSAGNRSMLNKVRMVQDTEFEIFQAKSPLLCLVDVLENKLIPILNWNQSLTNKVLECALNVGQNGGEP